MDKIQRLRSLAELNFCKRCFELYKALIEGSIKTLLTKPLNDWAWIEYQITQMVMKTEGVFKTNEIIIPDRNEVEKYADQIDVKKFREINGTWSFQKENRLSSPKRNPSRFFS